MQVIYIMVLRITISSLVIAALLYLSIVFFPECMNINEDVTKWVFITIVTILFVISRNKWWVNFASWILGQVIFGIIIILSVQ